MWSTANIQPNRITHRPASISATMPTTRFALDVIAKSCSGKENLHYHGALSHSLKTIHKVRTGPSDKLIENSRFLPQTLISMYRSARIAQLVGKDIRPSLPICPIDQCGWRGN